jgi:hypothetical protein
VGDPAEEILACVDDRDIDLVMMSTHGRSGISRWDLGCVATKMVHGSHVPVWLVPSELREEVILDVLPNRTLVVPLSGSKQSETVIAHAAAVAMAISVGWSSAASRRTSSIWSRRRPCCWSDRPRALPAEDGEDPPAYRVRGTAYA